MNKAAEVLVCGAGPVGLITALGLAQRGVSVIVIDAAPDINDSPRAMVYFPSTIKIFDEMGLLPDVEAVALKGYTYSEYMPDFDFELRVDSREVGMGEFTYDFQFHVGQGEIGRILLRHLARLGVDVRFSTRLLDFSEYRGGITVNVEAQTGREQLSATWLVGADGARSTVRKLLHVGFEGLTWPDRFIATNLYWDFDRHGYANGNFVCDPVNGWSMAAMIDRAGLWRLTFAENAELAEETLQERLPEHLAARLPGSAPYELVAARPYSIHQRAATQLREGRVVLAGDAAHITNPLGGFGLSGGLWDGVVLAEILAAILDHKADESVLDHYSDERRRVFWEVASPQAIANKERVSETDPLKRRAIYEGLVAVSKNPLLMRDVVYTAFLLAGDPIIPQSRWHDRRMMPPRG